MRYFVIPALLVLSSAALAVSPASWNHASEADFAGGEFDLTVVSSLGEISLSRRLSVLMPAEQAGEAIAALAVDGKTIYAASAVRPVIYRVRGRKAERFAKLPGTMVTALLWTGDGLLAAVGGNKAGIYTVDSAGKAKLWWSDGDVKYVWAMAPAPAGGLYAATGPKATVYAIDADGKGQAIYAAGKSARNVTCLARSKVGLLYAGTDHSGLVVEINPVDNSTRIVLDAPEKEISCLLGDEEGGLYVGTADSDKADRKAAEAPKSTADGRPATMTRPAAGPPESQDEPADEAAEAAEEPPEEADGGGEGAAPAASQPTSAPDSDNEPPAPAVDKSEVISRFAAPAPSPASVPTGKGNAVYYIRPDGLVRTVFRRPVTVLAMLADNDGLLLGTGNGGVIYSVSLDGDRVAQLANTDAKQVTALAADAAGQVVFATANNGSVGAIAAELAKEGTFTSEPLDAKQIAMWGAARAAVRGGGRVTLATRSGNTAEADDKTWSDWSPEMPAKGMVEVASPAGRFLQYRLTLAAARGDAPVVENVEIIYQVGNLAPVVSAVQVEASITERKGKQPETGPQPFRLITFTATDANKDKMTFGIDFREVGGGGWITLAKDLKAPTHAWDTRGVGDGVYELRITADDSPDNPPGSALQGRRISAPITVDNTPPLVTSIAAKLSTKSVRVTGWAEDRASRIAAIHYSVDSQDEWVAVLPADGIADSGAEGFAFTLEKLSSGPHRIAVRVTDLFGNAGYGTLNITVGE